MTVNFKCPDCGHDRLQEISYSVTLTNEIFAFAELHDGEIEIEYAPDAREIGYSADTEVNTTYKCESCGFMPEHNGEPIRIAKDLYAWLKKRKMLR